LYRESTGSKENYNKFEGFELIQENPLAEARRGEEKGYAT